MMKIGITGNIASGKSEIEKRLKEKGILTIDADREVHKLYESDKDVIERVSDIFEHDGFDVKDEKGGIDKKKVESIVFRDKPKLKKLEEIVHPRVKEEFEKFFNNNAQEKIVAGIAPLLYEAKMEKMFDYVILVTVDKLTQLKRLMARNKKLSEEQALARINLQMPQEEKIKKADFIIDNSNDFDDTESQLDDILKQVKNLVR